jgi:uncharacterized membrane protein
MDTQMKQSNEDSVSYLMIIALLIQCVTSTFGIMLNHTQLSAILVTSATSLNLLFIFCLSFYGYDVTITKDEHIKTS